MFDKYKSVKSLVYVLPLALSFCGPSFGAGFSLYTEGSTSELSVFAAGSAAEAPDASTAWYNPAGLVLLPESEILFNGIGVFPSTKLTGSSTYNTDDVPPYIQSFSGLDSGQRAFIPTIHAAHPLGDRAAFGFSILVPFGLSSDWPGDSAVRYAGTFTELLAIDVSPDIAGFITDNLSIGLGLDFQWAKVTFNAVAGSPAGLQYLESIGVPVTPTTLDSRSENSGTSFGIGFHAGALALFNDARTRVGFNFQSSVNHQFNGFSTLTGPLADINLTNPETSYQLQNLMSNDIRLPNISTLSVYQKLTDRWAILGSAVFTGWGVFENTVLKNVAGYDADSGLQAPINILVEQQYRNTWRFALGTTYDMNAAWMIRFGAGFDQTPTVNDERDARLPDVNRWALAIGLHYQPRPTLAFDVGYVYLWGVGRTPVHKTQIISELSSVSIDAWGMAHAQIAGFQAVWRPLD